MELRMCKRCGKEFENQDNELYCSFECFYKIPES